MCRILRDITGVVGVIVVIAAEAYIESVKDVVKTGCRTVKGVNDFVRG